MGPEVNNQERTRFIRDRLSLYLVVFIGLLLVLTGRLWYLQVLEGERFRSLAENNRVRVKPLIAPRGVIYDRNGQVIAESRLSFDVRLVNDGTKDVGPVLDRLSQILQFDSSGARELLARNGTRRPDIIMVKSDISREELARVETHRLTLPQVEVTVVPRRYYPFGSLASHFLGYVGEIGAELSEPQFKSYRRGSLIGKGGLEAGYERFLRGAEGREMVEVNSLGKEIRLLDIAEPLQGNNIVTTLDWNLQLAAERAMAGKDGAVVAVDPRTGEVLAMVSNPSYDPNLFGPGMSADEWSELREDPRHPLQNRAFQGQYPPGSTFKLVTALAALEEGVVTPATRFYCPGYLPFGDRTFVCWLKEGHGSVDLHRALVISCDVYFYNLGIRLGIDRIAKYAAMMGLGGLTGVDLPGEKPGLIPSNDFREKVLRRKWYAGEALSVAIGQGYNVVTPLQLLLAYAAVVNGGTVVRPWTVKRVVDPLGRVIKEFRGEPVGYLDVDRENLEIIVRALDGVVNEGGTGGRARLPSIRVGGKTGTAQVVGREVSKIKKEEFKDHAWFVGFAPVEKPEIAVVALVEHGGHGGSAAAPVVRQVLEAYFSGKMGEIAEPKKASAPQVVRQREESVH